MKDHLLEIAVIAGFAIISYFAGYSNGKVVGENIGLRAQDSKSIVTLGVMVTRLDKELKIANRVMNAVAKRDSTGEDEKFMNQAIQRLRDNK